MTTLKLVAIPITRVVNNMYKIYTKCKPKE